MARSRQAQLLSYHLPCKPYFFSSSLLTCLSPPAFGVCGGCEGASGISISEKSSWDTALMVNASETYMT